MEPRSILYIWVGVALSTLTACEWLKLESLNPSSPPSSTASPTASLSPKPGGAPPTPFQSASRITPLSIEGQSVEVELRLFNSAALPFTTYFPAQDFQPEVSEAGGEQNIRFYFSPTGQKDGKAYVQIILPSQGNRVDEMRELILSDRGIMATNRWELVDRTDVVSYPWAKEKFIYQQKTPSGMAIGAIYIGEDNGKAFYVLTHYPAEYSEGFEPRSAVILENLQFRK
jgi:hypothetical protein